MGIKEEPSYIDGKVNPIFGSVKVIKNKDMKTIHNFDHNHYWVVEQKYDDFTNIVCECGKGKMIDNKIRIVDGEMVI